MLLFMICLISTWQLHLVNSISLFQTIKNLFVAFVLSQIHIITEWMRAWGTEHNRWKTSRHRGTGRNPASVCRSLQVPTPNGSGRSTSEGRWCVPPAPSSPGKPSTASRNTWRSAKRSVGEADVHQAGRGRGLPTVPIYQWYQYANGTNIPMVPIEYQYIIGRSMVPVYHWYQYTIGRSMVPVYHWSQYTIGRSMVPIYHWQINGTSIPLIPIYHWQINGTSIPLIPIYHWQINGTNIPLTDQWYQYTIDTNIPLADQCYQYTSW